MRNLSRLVAFLLIPCLIADPLFAVAAIFQQQRVSTHPSTITSIFEENHFQAEALETAGFWMSHVLENMRTAPHVRALAVISATGIAVGVLAAHPHISSTFWHRSLWIAVAAALGWISRKLGFVPNGLMVNSPDEMAPTQKAQLQQIISKLQTLERNGAISVDAAREALAAWIDGKIKLSGEELDFIVERNGKEISLGSMDRAFFQKYGWPRLVVGVLIRMPDRTFLFHARAHTKSQKFRLSALGGHVKAGETRADAALREVHEELGLPAGYRMTGQLTPIAESLQLTEGDPLNNERIDAFIYDISGLANAGLDGRSEEEATLESMRRLDSAKAIHSPESYRQFLEDDSEKPGGGEVWSYLTLTKDQMMRIAKETADKVHESEGVPATTVTDVFKDGQTETRPAQMTGGLAQFLLFPDIRDRIIESTPRGPLAGASDPPVLKFQEATAFLQNQEWIKDRHPKISWKKQGDWWGLELAIAHPTEPGEEMYLRILQRDLDSGHTRYRVEYYGPPSEQWETTDPLELHAFVVQMLEEVKGMNRVELPPDAFRYPLALSNKEVFKLEIGNMIYTRRLVNMDDEKTKQTLKEVRPFFDWENLDRPVYIITVWVFDEPSDYWYPRGLGSFYGFQYGSLNSILHAYGPVHSIKGFYEKAIRLGHGEGSAKKDKYVGFDYFVHVDADQKTVYLVHPGSTVPAKSSKQIGILDRLGNTRSIWGLLSIAAMILSAGFGSLFKETLRPSPISSHLSDRRTFIAA